MLKFGNAGDVYTPLAVSEPRKHGDVPHVPGVQTLPWPATSVTAPFCGSGFQFTPSVVRRMRGGGHDPCGTQPIVRLFEGLHSKISPEVTPPAYKACTPPGSFTTVKPRKPMSRAVATSGPVGPGGPVHLPPQLTVLSELGDWKTIVQRLVAGLYCQISACRGRL